MNWLNNHIFPYLIVIQHNLKSRLIVAVVLLVFAVFLSLRLLNFVSLHGVNLLFWDQWEFLTPLFEQRDLWTMFRYQHGPHRQGLGMFLTHVTANLTNWNTRAESFSIAFLVIIAMLCAFMLKYSIHRTLNLTDIFIPLVFLNLIQYETFIGTPNPAHSATPLLLSILYCLAWLIPNNWIKTITVLSLNFLLLYTGFGVFMGIITLGVFLIESIRNICMRQRSALVVSGLALIISLFSIGTFLIGYKFNPSLDCFGISKISLIKYPIFMSLMFARFIRLGFRDLMYVSIIVGLILLSVSITVLFFHVYKLTQHRGHERHASMVIAILIGLTLLFSLGTAVGRTCSGLQAAYSSRYMTLMIPAFLGLYLHLCFVGKVIPRIVLTTP